LLLRSLRTLPVRLERITITTQQVVSFLKNRDGVTNVIFPLHADFPQFELAKKQMKGACGLVTFSVNAKGLKQIEKFCESLKHIMMAVSWGGHESLLLPSCAGIKASDFDPLNKQHKIIRLYCGLEDPAYIIDDIDQALAQAGIR